MSDDATCSSATVRKKIVLKRTGDSPDTCYLFKVGDGWHHCHSSPSGGWNCGPLTVDRLEHHYIMMDYSGVERDLPEGAEREIDRYLQSDT